MSDQKLEEAMDKLLEKEKQASLERLEKLEDLYHAVGRFLNDAPTEVAKFLELKEALDRVKK